MALTEEEIARYSKMRDDAIKASKERRSQIFYFDENNKLTSKDKASTAIIREYDSNGNVIKETFGYLNRNEENTRQIKM